MRRLRSEPTRPRASASFILAHRRVPDVHAFVEGAAGQVLAVGAEGHAVDGLLVLGQRVDADAALHVPQSHGGVEGGAEGRQEGDGSARMGWSE